MKGIYQFGGVIAVAISLSAIGGVSAAPPSELADRVDVADRLMPLFEAALRNHSMFEHASNAPHGIGRTHNPSPVLSAAKTFGEAIERFPIHPEIVKVVELQMRQGGINWSDLNTNQRHRLIDWALKLNASRSDGVLLLQLQLAGGHLSGPALRSLHRLVPKPDWQPPLWSNARALQLSSERALVIHREGDFLWIDQAHLVREINQEMASSDYAFSDPGGNLTPRIPIALDLGADGRLLVVTRRPVSYTTQAHSKTFLRVARQWQCVPVPLYAYTAGALLPDNRISLGEQHGRVLRQSADGWSESRPFESSAVLALRVSGDYLYAIAEDGRIAVQPCAAPEEWRTVYAGSREIVSAVALEDDALLVLDASGGLHRVDSQQAQAVAIELGTHGAESPRPLEVFKWGELLVAAFAADATLFLYRVDGLETKLQASANIEALPGKARAVRVVPYAVDRAIVFDDATLDRQIFDRQLVINLAGEVVGEFSVNRALEAAMAQVHRERREARARAEREGKKFDIIALMDAQAGRAVEIEALRRED